MKKRRMRIVIAGILVCLVFCTLYAVGYEKQHTMYVVSALPEWGEERQILLPEGAFLDERGVWTVKTVDTIWGQRRILDKEAVKVIKQEDGRICVTGLMMGIQTQIVTSCSGELEIGTLVVVDET